MKDRVISYLAAVFLNLALVGSTLPFPPVWRLSRPGVVRLFGGTRVTALRSADDGARVSIGFLLEDRVHLAAADSQEKLFPRTLLWLRSEPAVAILN